MVKLYELKHPNGYVLGIAYRNAHGWRFIPRVCGRSPSRKHYETADECLPRWAKKLLNSGCSFLSPEETS